MSLYIQRENQALLWNAISKTPPFQEWPRTGPTQQEWFKEIVQDIYQQYQGKQLTVQEVQQINRQTISIMLQRLPVAPSNSNRLIMETFPTTKTEQIAVTRDYILEQKQDEIARQFQERQNEYNVMLKRGPVQEIDFRLATEPDKPLENVDTIIQEQMKRRKYEIQQVTATTAAAAAQEPPSSTTKKVHWSTEEVSIQNEMVDLSDPSATNNISALAKHIPYLLETMADMREQLRCLREELDELRLSKVPEPEPLAVL